jgi:hypothetical protein
MSVAERMDGETLRELAMSMQLDFAATPYPQLVGYRYIDKVTPDL